jgi:hypothetical protein
MKHTASLPPPSPAAAFTAAERAFIRQAFGLHFGQYPLVSEGIFLRIWRSGADAGQPKLPPAVKAMMERSLLEVRPMSPWPRAFFTKAGLKASRVLIANPRYFDPTTHGHIGRELAIDKTE